jgi:hypothetical protein
MPQICYNLKATTNNLTKKRIPNKNILYNKKPLIRKTQKIIFLVKCLLLVELQKTTNGTNKQGWYFKTFQELPMDVWNPQTLK